MAAKTKYEVVEKQTVEVTFEPAPFVVDTEKWLLKLSDGEYYRPVAKAPLVWKDEQPGDKIVWNLTTASGTVADGGHCEVRLKRQVS